MGLNFAIDELYATGWTALDSTGCEYHSDGRAYPTPPRVKKFFDEHGHELSIRHVQLFDCYRAEWREMQGRSTGAVVGQTEHEAAVYALSQLRRQIAGQMAGATA
jgi:hypothetical protein